MKPWKDETCNRWYIAIGERGPGREPEVLRAPLTGKVYEFVTPEAAQEYIDAQPKPEVKAKTKAA